MPGPAAEYSPSHYSPADAASYVAYTFVGNCVNYATAFLLVYELVTSLDDEVDRVWSLKWRLPKILFVLNRYIIRFMLVTLWVLADFPGTSPEFCRIYGYWQMIPLRLCILAAQALLVIRVWAIYNNSRPMLYFLCFLYGTEFLAVTGSVVAATMDTHAIAQPAPLSCALSSVSGHILKQFASATWIAPVCFEFIMVIITLVKLLPRWSFNSRRNSHIGSGNGVALFGFDFGSGGNQTLDILARDSLVYFLFIFSFTLTNAIIYELSFSAYYHAILLGPTSAISCIAVSRMMINIRSIPSPGSTKDDGTGPLSLSHTYQMQSQGNYTHFAGERPSHENYPFYAYSKSNLKRQMSVPDLETDLAFSDTYGESGHGLGNIPPDPQVLEANEEEEPPGSAAPFLQASATSSRATSRAGSREDLSRPPRKSRDIAYPPKRKKPPPLGYYAGLPGTAESAMSAGASTLVGSPPSSPYALATPIASTPHDPLLVATSPIRDAVLAVVSSSANSSPFPPPASTSRRPQTAPSLSRGLATDSDEYVYESGYEAGLRMAKEKRERGKQRPGTSAG